MRLTLGHKAILLVSIFLLIELAFVGSLTYLLKLTEEEARREERAKITLGHVEKLVRLSYTAGSALKQFAVARDEESLKRFDAQAQEVEEHLNWLGANIAGRDRPLFARVERNLKYGFEILRRARNLIASTEDSLSLLDPLQKMNREIDPVLKAVLPDFIELRKGQERIESESPDQQRAFRRTIERILYLGLAINMLAAILAGVLFVRGITSRVEILVDNTRRLAESRPLNAELRGSDEIAELDHVFHRMAAALKEAARRELEIQKLRQAFVAMVSHDLRTPLTSVQVYLQLLTGGALGGLSDKAREKGVRAEKSVERLVELINDLLEVEKLESGAVNLKLVPVTVAEILQGSIEAVADLAEKEQVDLDIADSSLGITVDRDRIIRVLTNLLGNAIKFSEPGKTVSVEVLETDTMVEFHVRDEGPGVPSELCEAIFEKFRQVKESDSTEKGGTGLGLPICKAIVEQHGGTIGVVSQEGSGSDFWFCLPRNAQSS